MSEEVMPKHIAIIMDGNRRWAKEHNLRPVSLGHKKGAEVLENITRYCSRRGIKYLTVYAFSTENWKRTKEEVGAIMIIMEKYLDRFLHTADLENVKLRIIGDIDADDFPKNLRDKLREMERRTDDNTGLQLNVALNYGGRSELVRATKMIAQDVLDGKLSVDDINEDTISNNLYTKGQDDPDLVIRTSGELRTSNFLPWQITYSEFLFLNKYWPDFEEEDINRAIQTFSERQRRVGK